MGSVPGASMGGGGFEDYGGIDPSMDPELAMAIRASTEEARAQEEARVSASWAALRNKQALEWDVLCCDVTLDAYSSFSSEDHSISLT